MADKHRASKRADPGTDDGANNGIGRDATDSCTDDTTADGAFLGGAGGEAEDGDRRKGNRKSLHFGAPIETGVNVLHSPSASV
jgi:hypothetical protein